MACRGAETPNNQRGAGRRQDISGRRRRKDSTHQIIPHTRDYKTEERIQYGCRDHYPYMPVRKFLKDQARKAIQWAMETEIPFTEPTRAKHIPKPITPETTSKTMSINPYDLKGKTTLMLKSLLVIHESIEDAEAWQGYEGTPDQLDQIRNEIYGILVMNPSVTTTEEVEDLWMEDYASRHLAEDQKVEV